MNKQQIYAAIQERYSRLMELKKEHGEAASIDVIEYAEMILIATSTAKTPYWKREELVKALNTMNAALNELESKRHEAAKHDPQPEGLPEMEIVDIDDLNEAKKDIEKNYTFDEDVSIGVRIYDDHEEEEYSIEVVVYVNGHEAKVYNLPYTYTKLSKAKLKGMSVKRIISKWFNCRAHQVIEGIEVYSI